jgi:hypothetical protein
VHLPVVMTPALPLSRPSAARSANAHIVALLRTPAGATIAAMMAATEWQQHSVRGFLAGVIRKKLGLNLVSEQTEVAALIDMHMLDCDFLPALVAMLRQRLHNGSICPRKLGGLDQIDLAALQGLLGEHGAPVAFH